MVTFSPAFFISAKVLVVIFFLSVSRNSSWLMLPLRLLRSWVLLVLLPMVKPKYAISGRPAGPYTVKKRRPVEGMSAWYSKHSAEKRQNKPCEHTLNYPVGFPTPIFNVMSRRAR